MLVWMLLLLLSGNLLAQDSLQILALPQPRLVGQHSLEEVLAARRSTRAYSPAPLSIAELGQLLWAAQGETSAHGERTAPSAGGTYPLEVFAVVQRVTGLPPGIYQYLATGHDLAAVSTFDPAPELNIAVGQKAVAEGAVVFVISAAPARITRKYGERAERFMVLEAGHAAQNLLLQAEALHLGAVPVGSFQEDSIRELTASEAEPLYLITVGKPRS